MFMGSFYETKPMLGTIVCISFHSIFAQLSAPPLTVFVAGAHFRRNCTDSVATFLRRVSFDAPKGLAVVDERRAWLPSADDRRRVLIFVLTGALAEQTERLAHHGIAVRAQRLREMQVQALGGGTPRGGVSVAARALGRGVRAKAFDEPRRGAGRIHHSPSKRRR
jgi:hypothetical protein